MCVPAALDSRNLVTISAGLVPRLINGSHKQHFVFPWLPLLVNHPMVSKFYTKSLQTMNVCLNHISVKKLMVLIKKYKNFFEQFLYI